MLEDSRGQRGRGGGLHGGGRGYPVVCDGDRGRLSDGGGFSVWLSHSVYYTSIFLILYMKFYSTILLILIFRFMLEGGINGYDFWMGFSPLFVYTEICN
ncbi:hypothetical protein SESBI_04468 [Sesbania bispinosa]|nr:hypothetical protein SESBI_04468 [Sesbania bispinosa]